MKSKKTRVGLFDQLKSGLEDSIAHSKGELTLKTTELPAPPPPVNARDVRRLRHSLRMSQGVFAAALNVSTKTVQSWEQGLRRPSDAALRVIQVVRSNPSIVGTFYPANGRK